MVVQEEAGRPDSLSFMPGLIAAQRDGCNPERGMDTTHDMGARDGGSVIETVLAYSPSRPEGWSTGLAPQGWSAFLDESGLGHEDWTALAMGREGLAVALRPGLALPSGLGRGPLWDVASALRPPPAALRVLLKPVASPFDICILAFGPGARDWAAEAELQRIEPVAAHAGAADLGEALSRGMRGVQRLTRRMDVKAAVLTLRGRGRVFGPVNPDLLFRFGVSAWN
jgi:hypothetical protein